MPRSVVRPQNGAVREGGIGYRVWRCLARLHIGTRGHRGRFGDGPGIRVSTTLPPTAVARDGQRQDDIGIGIGSDWVIGDAERVRVGQRARSVVRVHSMVPFVPVASASPYKRRCRTSRCPRPRNGPASSVMVKSSDDVRDGRLGCRCRDGQRECYNVARIQWRWIIRGAQRVALLSVPAPLCVKGWCRS